MKYSISDLFSTPNRDYLVCSNGDKVKVDSLKGKLVGVYFVLLYKLNDWVEEVIHTMDAYDEISLNKGDFEIVLVAVAAAGNGDEDDDEEVFYRCFSAMPWLAIPFSDVESRSYLTELFIGDDIDIYVTGLFCTILNPSGRSLEDPDFETYGADCYPFTSERITEIKREDILSKRKMRRERSLQALLASPNRDYVISKHGEEVPISELEGKVVGLFFYGGSLSASLLPKLIEVYGKLKEQGILDFEIVFINIHFLEYGYPDEKTFNENFGKMPWLSLPFKDKNCKKLWRYFIKDEHVDQEDGTLLFIDAFRKSFDRCGIKVLMEFGAEGYPFTLERGAELEKDRLRAQTIESLVLSAHHNYLIKNDGQMVPVSELSGKNVMLFVVGVDQLDRWFTVDWLPDIIEWYGEIKMKDDSFEVIYVPYDCDVAYFNNLFCKMPWLAIPFDNGRLYSLLTCVLKTRILPRCLPAFGSDGRLLTLNAFSKLEDDGVDAYPFTDVNLLTEAEDVFKLRFVWSDTEEDENPGPQYTRLPRNL